MTSTVRGSVLTWTHVDGEEWDVGVGGSWAHNGRQKQEYIHTDAESER